DAQSGRLLRTVALQGDAETVAIDRRRGRVFVPATGFDHVAVLDARTGAALPSLRVTQPSGGTILGDAVVDEHSGRLFVGLSSGSVSVVDTQRGSVLWMARVGSTPAALAVTEQASRVVVANQ